MYRASMCVMDRCLSRMWLHAITAELQESTGYSMHHVRDVQVDNKDAVACARAPREYAIYVM
jgi:hypothetical protein